MHQWKNILSAGLVGILLVSSIPVHAKDASKREWDGDIHVKPSHQSEGIRASQSKQFRNIPYSKNLVIIHFDGPIEEEWKKTVEDLDVELGDYLPDYSFIAKLPNKRSVLQKIRDLSFVTGVEKFHPALKIAPELLDQLEEKQKIEVYATGFGRQENVRNEIRNTTAKVKSSDSGKTTQLVIDTDDINDLILSDDIIYVAPVSKMEFHNDVAETIIGSDELKKTGYRGNNQIISVADSGLDTGNLKTMHPDLRGQVKKLTSISNDPRDFVGHGTHVAGSVVGNGTLSNEEVTGMAPGAALLFYAMADANGNPMDIDYNKVWTDAYKNGARINSLSVGTDGQLAAYTYDSQLVDRFLWEHPDAISLVSAGNEGDEHSDEYYTVTAPATAKNVISVGASESYRTKYGDFSDNPDEVAYFSSRGPTLDGRIKPDVVAPGTAIFSTRSILSNSYVDVMGAYGLMSGTSMATPITAGGVAQIREYLQEQGRTNPSGALLKALLISGADDLGDNLARMGFGRVNLPNSINSSFVDEQTGLKTGDKLTYQVKVKETNKPFNVTLAWTDFPASLLASHTLVNDLNLIVTSPTGERFNGNDFEDQPDDDTDNVNNVEQVYMGRPEKGIYTITVSGHNIPKGPQPFALSTSGELKPKLISDSSLQVTTIFSKDSIKLSVKGKVDPSVKKVTVNAPGLKNVSAKLSKGAFSLTNTVKITSSPIEEMKVSAQDKEGNVDAVVVKVEQDLIDDESITVRSSTSNSQYTYELNGDVNSSIKSAYYLLNKKLYALKVNANSISGSISSEKALEETWILVVDKKGKYELVHLSLN